MTSELPADVLAFLKQQAAGVPTRSAPNGDARHLLDKYEPKTLADYGTITYTRRFRHHQRWEIVEHSPDGDRNTDGLHLRHDNEPLSDTRLVPWPDDGGICDLLNDGWRLVPESELDHDWELFNPDHLSDIIAPVATRFSEITNVLVLAREVQP